MQKSVLISIQPYWVFLIIARLIGWDILQEKTVEVRKDLPKDNAWNKVVHIYCSKNRKSFNRIPKKYQPLMAKFLGKVIGEFVCDRIECIQENHIYNAAVLRKESCLSIQEIAEYTKGKTFYAWHISDLKIYDKPKELGEFWRPCPNKSIEKILDCVAGIKSCKYKTEELPFQCTAQITRPPQSWCYVDEV